MKFFAPCEKPAIAIQAPSHSFDPAFGIAFVSVRNILRQPRHARRIHLQDDDLARRITPRHRPVKPHQMQYAGRGPQGRRQCLQQAGIAGLIESSFTPADFQIFAGRRLPVLGPKPFRNIAAPDDKTTMPAVINYMESGGLHG